MGADVLRSASALLESRFGNLDDLPDELADTVANYCYRWALLENDRGIRRRLVRHLPAGTDPEQRLKDHDAALASAIERFPSMLKALRDLRRTDGDAVFSRSCELFVDRFKYRIPGAEQKSRIRRAVERRLRRSEEIHGLYRVLLSVCAPERATPAEDLMTKLAVTIAAAAAILCAGAGLSDRAYALTAGWPAGVLAAAAAVDPVERTGCWKYGSFGWGYYPCGPRRAHGRHAAIEPLGPAEQPLCRRWDWGHGWGWFGCVDNLYRGPAWGWTYWSL
jgi:hypothetical protein